MGDSCRNGSKCHAGTLKLRIANCIILEHLKNKGHPPSADLRYGRKDSISPSTLIFAAIKSKLGINTLHIHFDVPKKLALR